MESAITVGALSPTEQTQIALSAIVAKAATLGRGVSEPERWRIYEQAKAAMGGFNPTAEQYEQTIRLLSEALKI